MKGCSYRKCAYVHQGLGDPGEGRLKLFRQEWSRLDKSRDENTLLLRCIADSNSEPGHRPYHALLLKITVDKKHCGRGKHFLVAFTRHRFYLTAVISLVTGELL